MPGLAFPADVAFDRETSYEYGIPVNNGNNIPIDPALGGQVIDPTLMELGEPVAKHVSSYQRRLMPRYTNASRLPVRMHFDRY